MRYDEWVAGVPEAIKGGSLWKMNVDRLVLFLADVGWRDATTLMQDRRTRELSDQLYWALGSIGANLAEGYSRGMAEIECASMNTRWVRPARAAIGVTKGAVC